MLPTFFFSRIKILLLLSVFIFSGMSCGSAQPKTDPNLGKPVTLNWWRVHDDPNSVSKIVDSFQTKHPNVVINVRTFRPEEYEYAILNALAEDRGPDILSLRSSWIPKYQTKLLPLPEEIRRVTAIDKSTQVEVRIEYSATKVATPTLSELRTKFSDFPFRSMLFNGRVFGVPLGVDTLAMFYNREYFNEQNIITAPTTWTQVIDAVKKLTLRNRKGDILQSGIALGGINNVVRSFDILSLLMLQEGTTMAFPGQVAFANSRGPFTNDIPGLSALRFYSDFANPIKDTYSWNESFPDSITAFARGQTAIAFGYPFHATRIRQLAPTLDFGVSEFPQIEGTPRSVNYGSMWLETVTKKSRHPDYAWDFVLSMMESSNAESYLQATGKVAALRELLAAQLKSDLAPFAQALPTATDWYRGFDLASAERSFSRMVEQYLNLPPGSDDVLVIQAGAAQVQQTYEAPNN